MDKPRVLIVEDEQIAGLDIQEMTEEAGYRVVDVYDTAEGALEGMKERSADLVLMDICLPGEMDGIDAAETINDRFDTSVIFLTAYSDEETLRRARATNPEGFLVKPITQADLKASFEMALGKRA